ncbi:MAG: linear amide C-N hydrolase [Kordiimonadaceae bacterium]|nr:linear amide C-N hydrolase [Kordiimonadaceae bacterium]
MIFIKRNLLVSIILLVLFGQDAANACSRLLWNNNGSLVMSARTFDWSYSLESMLYINPRGLTMNGGTTENPAEWTVKYGSVTTAISSWLQKQGPFTLADGATDGINEKGLAAHALFLQNTVFEKLEPSKPALTSLRWIRYLLDNFATVEEALAGMNTVDIVPGKIGNNLMRFHVALEDKSGDTAIIEFIGGKQVIYHGHDVRVMTNNPPYDAQIKNLEKYKSFGGQKPLPGNVESTDRFVRLSYFSKFLPATNNPDTASSYLLSTMRTAASPYGAPYASGGVYPTWWTSVIDLTNGLYYFNWTETPNLIKVALPALDFSENSGTRVLDPRRPDLFGTVNNQFLPVSLND